MKIIISLQYVKGLKAMKISEQFKTFRAILRGSRSL